MSAFKNTRMIGFSVVGLMSILTWVGLVGCGSKGGGGSGGSSEVGSWKAISTTGAAKTGAGGTAIWTGSKMITFGGSLNSGNGAGDSYFNEVGIYDPNSDSWQKPDTAGIGLTPRAYHVAVWTGSKMILWGGITGARAPVDSGTFYDPSANTASDMSVINAPSGRVGAHGFWTGTKLIIWGGGGAWGGTGELLNTGGIYDAATDSWATMSTTNAPSARTGASVVWTGTDMIVWGGRTGSESQTALNDGTKYNLATNTWTPISATNAPTGDRFGHGAVWTGSKMVVIGGDGSECVYPALTEQAGASYDPTSDSWTAITTSVDCTGKSWFANWTGSKVIGIKEEAFEGGVTLDPQANSQEIIAGFSFSSIGGPSVLDVKPVWTGTQLIILGRNFLNNTTNAAGVALTL